jgi:molecular chaperone GrpE
MGKHDDELREEEVRPDEEPRAVAEQQTAEAEEEAPVAETGETGEEQSLAAQLEAQQEKYLRLMAEFDNYKRRTSREYERLVASANERLMLEIIGVRENFQRALAMEQEGAEVAKFVEGMKLIFNQLDEVLCKNGLSVFTEVGDEFDPEIHDAMMKIPDPDVPDGHVAQIYEQGYRLRERVIKHAKVIVSSGPAEGERTEEQEEPSGTE